jgi:hypothetical protein
MTVEERDAFLSGQRTCRVATSGSQGPHLTALWFVWDGDTLWLNSIVDSQRWADLQSDPRISVLVDTGQEFDELQGVEIRGRAVPVGDVPRTGQPNPELVDPERRFGEKYAGGSFTHDGRHAWLRVEPDKIVSWDFTKMVLA